MQNEIILILMEELRTILGSSESLDHLNMDQLTLENFQSYIEYSDECYRRIPLMTDSKTNRIAYLLCWAPNQCSGIHDHPDGGCLVKLLQGQLEEVSYDHEFPHGSRHTLIPGDYSYQCGHLGLHNIINGSLASVSLHIYSPMDYKPTFHEECPHLLFKENLSVVQIESQLLGQLKNLFILQLNEQCGACSNILEHVRPDGQLLLDISTDHHITDDHGWGQCTHNYTWTVKVNMDGTVYIGTIKYTYGGGSCEGCDRVIYANSGSYQDEDNIVNPKHYMIEEIGTLKFHTLRAEQEPELS